VTKYQMQCPHCGVKLNFSEKLLGQTRACPKCSAPVMLTPGAKEATPPREPGQPAPDEEVPPPPMAPAAGEPEAVQRQAARPAARFPERMKANKALAGRTCLVCREQIELGEDVFNCQKCGDTVHLRCHEKAGGCQNSKCVTVSRPAAAPAPGFSVPPPVGEAMKECRFCGEPIRVNALKCYHCGEYQRDEDRKSVGKKAEDENLTTGDIILGILCSGIGCIFGIVWAIRGKKKGGKMILLSLASSAFWTLVRFIIEAAMRDS